MARKGQEHLYPDMVGKVFGRLTVVKRLESTPRGARRWECVCECGKIVSAKGNNLRCGKVRSCGCSRNTQDGWGKTRFYNTFRNMHKRCYVTTSIGYMNYGGRGIHVHSDWHSFEKFKDDMLDSYLEHCNEHGERHTTLDRIDVNKSYSKDNCRWATYKVQHNNRSNNRVVEIDGFFGTFAQVAQMHGLNPYTVHNRIKDGWDIEMAFKTPARKKKSSF